jgi:polysaccharide pyruvyl transferase WcaK-like protein
MPTALLVGAFGQQNPDDEAALDAFLAALPDWRIVATSRHPARTAATHGCAAVRDRDVRALARALLSTDAVVFGGGTVFASPHPAARGSPDDALTWALRLTTGGQAISKPVAMLGVGADPLSDTRARRLARTLVRRTDLLVLRDEESAHVLSAAGAPIPFRVGADPAWTLVDELPTAQERESVIVALSHPAEGQHLGDLADRLAAALAPLATSGTKVELQPWHDSHAPAGGGGLESAIAARLGSRVQVARPPADLSDARIRVAGARLVVCMCAYAMMAAAAAGTPFVALAHERRQVSLARRLQQPAVLITADPTRIADELLRGLGGRAASPAAVRAEIARAAEGFRLLRLLLTGGAAAEMDTFDGLSLVPAPWTAN